MNNKLQSDILSLLVSGRFLVCLRSHSLGADAPLVLITPTKPPGCTKIDVRTYRDRAREAVSSLTRTCTTSLLVLWCSHSRR